MMNARFRKTDGAGQGLSEHCRGVACLTGDALGTLELESTGRLVGLLHDMGKAPEAFQDYLRMSHAHPESRERRPVLHAPIGAIYAYDRWFNGDRFAKLTAQIVSMAIYGHHAGLPDCLNEKGESPYLRYFSHEEKDKMHYREAVENYLREIAGADELDKLFARSKAEISALFARLEPDVRAFQLGMVARTVLGALVDADRWDSACFEYGADPFAPGEQPADWADLLARFEAHLSKFTGQSPLNDTRARISRDCLDCASMPPGIFTLTVPTGGGKTFATLRYALAHADGAHMRRIFYVIPFNTILDQNAADIREALNNYEGILEHHSGVVPDDAEEATYRLLTERWDSPIVLTSMVQFLNTLYRKENSNARRMGALAHSVLIFDEIQALPKRCTHLFEQAIRFLVRFYGCTVVLCTATQPRLNLPAQPMIGEVSKRFEDMRRVHYVDQSRTAIDNAQASAKLVELMAAHGFVLAVVNTRLVAQAIYRLMKTALAGRAACFHLSTNMCPAHRLSILDEVKRRTDRNARLPTFLISTALIEAGINVSFPAVVRSLVGLPSIIQAAGRCNRNQEADMGTVYLWKLAEETLSDKLAEIRAGQELSDNFLRHFEENIDRIGDPDVISLYFEDERECFGSVLCYPYVSWNTDLCEMLSKNQTCQNTAFEAHMGACSRLALPQSFRTAGEAFKVIDQDTRSILVPYGEGQTIIGDLLGAHDMKDEIRLIRRAQRFSVSMSEHIYRALANREALYTIGETGIVALREPFYDADIGLTIEPGAMDLLYTE